MNTRFLYFEDDIQSKTALV